MKTINQQPKGTGMIRQLLKELIRDELCGSEPHAESDFSDFGSLHKIVVCQRGFVYAGDVATVGDYIVIANAVNVRKWGTTKGLGELAAKGSLPDTKADATGTVRVHRLAVVSMIDCEARINATA